MRFLSGIAAAICGAVLTALAQAAVQEDEAARLSREVVRLTEEVSRNITLVEWRRAHSESTVSPGIEACVEASYSFQVTPGATPVEVRARFYLPQTPASLELPAASSRLIDSCWLGRFQIYRRSPADSAPHNTAPEVVRALSAKLGAPVALPKGWVGKLPMAYWTGHTNATLDEYRGALTFTSARDGSGIGLDLTGGPFEAAQREAFRIAGVDRLARFDEVVQLASAGSDAVQRVRLRIPSWLNEQTAPSDGDDLVTAVGALLAQQPVDAARHLAVELLVMFAQNAPVADMTQQAPAAAALRKRLESHGVRFKFAPLGRASLYDHGFLKKAYAMPAPPRIEELVFLTYMEIGFETDFACRDQRGAGHRAVIARGRKFLADHPETAIAGAIYGHTAMAYGDMISSEGTQAFVDADARTARPRAIDAFNEALKRDGATPQLAALWPDMWRMRAGLGPTRSYFICYYD